MISSKDFWVKPDKSIKLRNWPTEVEPVYTSAADYEKILSQHIQRLTAQQELLYASNAQAILLIFQGMDAAGKDSAIKHVMSGVNPQGCQVYSFKPPSHEELQHDFLWRSTAKLPEKGHIGIFNRSYYEEVLVPRVHAEVLSAERLAELPAKRAAVWRQRYRSIVHYERHLRSNGTHIIKFFLHVSKEEQRKRFLARLEDPTKNWKFGSGDMEDRRLWDKYMKAYADCLTATSTKDCPWFIVPADDKENARLIISHILLEWLGDMKMTYPVPTEERQQELKNIERQLLG